MTHEKNAKGFDFIGDIHGRADVLERLLQRLGYQQEGTTYRHPNRIAFFVGDFIDGGNQNRRVLEIVRGMVERDYALAVMGNHEYNAICYHTPDPERSGKYLRKRNDKNIGQHRTTLAEFEGDDAGLRDMIDWFWTLPLFTDFGINFRVVHACWHEPSREVVEAALGRRALLTHDFLVRSARKDSAEHRAVETLLKGLEIELPDGVTFVDEHGKGRSQARLRWWLDDARSLPDMVIGPETLYEQTAGHPPRREALMGYDSGEGMVFFGHYWLKGTPEAQASNVACLDYSAGRGPGHKLVAYRRDAGSRFIEDENFVWENV